MKKYIVSLVIKQNKPNGVLNIMNCVNTKIMANSKEEAFGIYFNQTAIKFPDHDLHSHLEFEL